MPATMCCHDLLMRDAMLSAYTPMTTCGSAVDAGGAVGPYCLTLADEDILAKNEIVDPSIGFQKRKEWLLLTTPEGERYRQAERAARHQKIRRYLSEKLSNLKRNHYKGMCIYTLTSLNK
ncbi:uncharacterized protein LOC120838334 [Ixodes scapularis]|uniref:uncharacterized protein LOC120838334 n=1 Tax=Ixodes scapularis TaxID=6945 RepID=UPI001A9EDF02|nr:uncharacterized protein LOC120838334 [Ixodes scapularis]